MAAKSAGAEVTDLKRVTSLEACLQPREPGSGRRLPGSVRTTPYMRYMAPVKPNILSEKKSPYVEKIIKI
jgi:hypothetical protein